MIPWLDPRSQPGFPPVRRALTEPNGLLAAGGELSPEWLLTAYEYGIFPWFSAGEPILWWSPDPRMVVFPHELRLTRSLLKTLRNEHFEVRCDTAFAQVMAACAAPREPGGGTWISPQIQDAYCRIHEMGWAHSIEAWREDELVGGLYGVAIGRVFYGESMFHRATDASKVAFAHLVRLLERLNFAVIDCQMSTDHLRSLGGREWPREEFQAGLKVWTQENVRPGSWAKECMRFDWRSQA
ncbi:leucyl/phenylalanyl-tRNA--protein transferase [Uliginosibacterium sp. H3]|uniref:Leucyl/phenylalanyl-tRNA--protein transferase n=1 Tax=Uliginosibacterium silvisoli TaxID=3114758 RepID=A0ABU6K1R0_9RHOO|nr:leucyl/phenylalanyl-tRNA--protein transferase [Uliginosibacterium sp. H3]